MIPNNDMPIHSHNNMCLTFLTASQPKRAIKCDVKQQKVHFDCNDEIIEVSLLVRFWCVACALALSAMFWFLVQRYFVLLDALIAQRTYRV